MGAKALGWRLSRVRAQIDPVPDARFLAYARAVIAWGGGEPDEDAALRLAHAFAGTRGGAPWEGLVELARGKDS